MNLLVLVGSLRADSLNLRLARAAVAEVPAGTTVRFFDRLADLPHYNEDLDVEPQHSAVTELRQAIAEADALLVVTPEYNGLLSGATKNAIDWASRPRGNAALVGTVVAVMSATGSPRGGQWAIESATRALAVGGATVLPQTVGVGSAFTMLEDDRLVDAGRADAVRDLMAALLDSERVAA